MFPSVTTVLEPYSGIADLRRRFPEVIKAAAERGTLVHGYCEAMAKGFMPVGIRPDLQGYLDSFMLWFENVAEVVAVELRLMHPSLGFHGQMDILCRLKGDAALSVWDYKSAVAVGRTWGPQLGAYFHLAKANSYPVARAGNLRLRKTGRPPLVNECTDTLHRNWNVFLSALNLHNHFKGSRR